jgi:hypothetical protein
MGPRERRSGTIISPFISIRIGRDQISEVRVGEGTRPDHSHVPHSFLGRSTAAHQREAGHQSRAVQAVSTAHQNRALPMGSTRITSSSAYATPFTVAPSTPGWAGDEHELLQQPGQGPSSNLPAVSGSEGLHPRRCVDW